MELGKKEEIGVSVSPKDIALVHTMHNLTGENHRLDLFFLVSRYAGTLENKEPHKCAEMRFFGVDELPEKTPESTRQALSCIQDNIAYSERR